jgi:dienelactone hydrolase
MKTGLCKAIGIFFVLIAGFYGTVLGQTRYLDEIFSTVNRTSNITYGSATGINNQPVTLRLHVFTPAGDQVAGRPLIIFIHGGGFTTGNLDDPRILAQCERFARRGYVTASVQYRLGLESNTMISYFEANLRGAQDIRAAIRFMRSNAQTYGVNPNRIFLAGQSAGGYVALAAAYLDKVNEYTPGANIQRWGQPEGNSNSIQASSAITAVVNLWGAIIDTNWIESGNVPVASLHGTNDATVPHTSNTYGMFSTPRIIAKANNLGIISQQKLIQGMGHGPGTTDQRNWDTITVFMRDFLYQFVPQQQQNPMIATLSQPENQAVNQPSTITLSWNQAQNAISYRVQVSADSTFSTAFADQITQQLSLTVPNLNWSSRYFWRVKTLGAQGIEAPWSIVRSFSTMRRPVQRDTCSMRIGMNVFTHSYYNYEQPFADLIKGASTLITANSKWISGGRNQWNTNLADSVERDAAGYIKRIPFWYPGVEDSQIVRMMMLRDIEGTYLSGDYICLYEGEGDITFELDAAVIARSAGRIEFRVNTPTNAGIQLTIRRSNPNNHVRNIRIVHSSRLHNYQQMPFTVEFIKKLRPFPVIRTMMWTRTNENPPAIWQNRFRADNYTQASGVAWEYVVQLANWTEKDVWINIPHHADSLYIVRLAALMRDNLHSQLKVYLEYSNEVWNGMFPQFNWVRNNAPAQLNDAQKYAWCMDRAFRIFMREWTGQENRIIRVAGAFSDNPWTARQIVQYMQPGSLQAISPGGYFNLSQAGQQAIIAKGQAATVQDIFDASRQWINTRGKSLMMEHAVLAEQAGLDLILYEAGQHITTIPFGTRQPWENAVWNAQRHPEMGTLYREWMEFLRDSANVKLFMGFVLAARNNSQYGSWGALANLYADPLQEPKYRAQAGFSCYTGPDVFLPIDSSIGIMRAENTEEQNPEILITGQGSDYLHVQMLLPYDAPIALYTADGRTVWQAEYQSGHMQSIYTQQFTPGVYFVCYRIQDKLKSVPVLLNIR